MGANAPGELIHAITTAVLASFIVTWVLLVGYRRAVARTMRTASAQAERAPSIELPVTPPAPLVRPAIDASATRRRLALVYGAAFGLSALVLALPLTWKIVQESGAESWPGLLANWMTIWAPSIVLLCALLAASRRSTIVALIAVWLLVVLSATALPALVRLMAGNYSMAGLGANAWQASGLFLINAIPPLALVYITGRRRVRNVLPIVLVMALLLSFLLLGYNRWQIGECAGHLHCEPDAGVAGDEYRNVYGTGFAIPVVKRSGRPSRMVAVAASGAPVPGVRIQQRATGG